MKSLNNRQRGFCPAGFLFYSCNTSQNKFEGCCSASATGVCDPGGGCPDGALPPQSSTSKSQQTLATPTTSSPQAATSPSAVQTTTTPKTTSATSLTTIHTSVSASATTKVSITAAPTSTTALPTSAITGSTHTVPHSHTGAIVGAVLGAILGLILLALLIFCCLRKRKRTRTERKSATIERRPSMKPVDRQEKHEMFAPFGGYYRGVHDSEPKKISHPIEITAPASSSSGYRAVNQTVPHDEQWHERTPQLDGRPIHFIPELDDTSTGTFRMTMRSPGEPESPILGRKNKGEKHALSWNNYDASEASSPPSTLSPNISPVTNYHVSPEVPYEAWHR